MIAVILALIGWNLSDIGWLEVLSSLPTHPLFYILFGVLYLSLPVTEVFIYRQVWKFRASEGFRAFLTKRVYNNEVIGYSGEFYLYLWAKKRLKLSGGDVMGNIRDSNIISATVSYIVAFTLVGTLIFTGIIDVKAFIGDVDWAIVVIGIVIIAILIVVIAQFRRHLFSLPAGKTARIFALYFTRFTLHHAVLVLMWSLVIPGAPISVWLTYIAVYIVVNRLPFFPSKDLLFAWAGIELSRYLGVGPAEVAGMLLVYSALNKLGNVALFAIFSYLGDVTPAEKED